MERQKLRFYKGLRGFTRSDDEALARDIEGTIYWWWWNYLRLSPAFWFAKETGYPIIDPQMAKTYELAGDLRNSNFRQWWDQTGKIVFAEVKRPPKVLALNLDALHEHPFKENALYLEVPLTIRKETILKKIKEELNKVHEGRELDVTKTANAPFKLHTKRYRPRIIELEYWVFLYRSLYSEIPMWRIGDRLQIAPNLKLRGVEWELAKSKFNQLASMTGRYHYKAKYLLANAEQMSFPNTKKISTENLKPFGRKHHNDFILATSTKDKDSSPWKQWLRNEFETDLKYEVARRNRVVEELKLPGSKVRLKMRDFIAGKTDLLN